MYIFERDDGGVGLAGVQWCECSAAAEEEGWRMRERGWWWNENVMGIKYYNMK